MLRRSKTLLLMLLTFVFAGIAAQASAKDYVLEDWDGPAPVGSWYSNPNLDTKGWTPVVSDPLTFSTWTGADVLGAEGPVRDGEVRVVRRTGHG